MILESSSWHESSKRQLQAGKMLSRQVFVSHKGSCHFIWKGKTRRIFNIFKMCIFVLSLSENCLKWSRGSRLGSPRALLGSSWGILKDFASLLGPTGAPCGPPLAPQNREKVGQRVFSEFHGFPGVFRGANRAPKRTQSAPKRDQNEPQDLPKWHPRHFWEKTCVTVPYYLNLNQDICFHKTDKFVSLVAVQSTTPKYIHNKLSTHAHKHAFSLSLSLSLSLTQHARTHAIHE